MPFSAQKPNFDYAYRHLTREQWGRYRHDSPLVLSEDDIERLGGVNDPVSLAEVETVFLPLSRLLQMLVDQSQQLQGIVGRFLGESKSKVPFIIGVSGSVAVGKSTISRVLQALLLSIPSINGVSLVTTDGFLQTTAELEAQNLMKRKGFPESYRLNALLEFLYAVKSGRQPLKVPVYSHIAYDIVPGEYHVVDQPDIVILEGLNLLQTGASLGYGAGPKVYVSDFIDFSIFVDASTTNIESWFIDRLLAFCQSSMQNPDAYFHYLTQLSPEELIKFGQRVWREINRVNLEENILPFRERADFILHKCADHSVDYVKLRNL